MEGLGTNWSLPRDFLQDERIFTDEHTFVCVSFELSSFKRPSHFNERWIRLDITFEEHVVSLANMRVAQLRAQTDSRLRDI